MTFAKGLGTGLFLTTLCFLIAPKAKADEWNQKTVVTFSEPFEVPGVGQHLLPAGTYVFKLLDDVNNHNIVRIYNADETKILATMLAIRVKRPDDLMNTTFTFEERKSDSPKALKSWFYPGEALGWELLYGKTSAGAVQAGK
jgi:hypothetical protein